MGHTITVRIDAELAQWLEESAASAGVSQGKIVRDQLELARSKSKPGAFMRLAGAVRGAKDLSTRKGFAKR